MAPKIDPEILKVLSLNSETTTLSSHGGSGFSSTFKLTTKNSNGEEKLFFVKIGKGKDSEVMFAGEHTSLNAIHAIVPSLCPISYAHGTLSESSNSYFLITDFLNLAPSSKSSAPSGSGLSLAQKLARLHSTPAPIPEGYEEPVFGFPVSTCCGKTVQDNTYNTSWAQFYAENRLRMILRSGERNQGKDAELSRLVEITVSKVVPVLLAAGHLKTSTGDPITPVVVHGDLWSGNHGLAPIGQGPVEEIVFDSSASWSHSEFEFGIMRMFGGFGAAFEREYHAIKGKDEPVGEWEDRIKLYELYHHLNHYAMFGGGYRGGAVSIMRDLTRRYGK